MSKIIEKHNEVQRFLVNIPILNPLADTLHEHCRNSQQLDHCIKIAETITLLHQHQRDIQTYRHEDQSFDYIEVSEADIQLTLDLAQHLFKITSLDELPEALKHTYQVIEECAQDLSFTRKEVLASGKVKRTTLHNHLHLLLRFDLIEKVKGTNGSQMSYLLTANS